MGPLNGVKVLDLSTMISAPFGTTLMADFGAEVIKVEMPKGGDPFRKLGPWKNGEGLRYAAMNRNKKSITLDLHTDEGRSMLLKMVEKVDVVMENFRPGTLAKWQVGADKMKEHNPDIIITHVSGYGQTGPDSPLPGFGTPATAFGGMTYILGYKDRPPVSPSFSLTDYVAGLYAALSTVMALYHRDAAHGKGQEIDVTLYESIFRFMETAVADYDQNRVVTERSAKLGSTTSSPAGTYRTRDGKWVVMVCSTDRTWEYLTTAMDMEWMRTDSRFCNVQQRLKNDEALDKIIGDWFLGLDYAESKRRCDEAGVPCNLIYSIADIWEDPQYKFRNDIVSVPHPRLGTLAMPGVTPLFSETPGEIKCVAPDLGQDNAEVYKEFLGLEETELARLKAQGVI